MVSLADFLLTQPLFKVLASLLRNREPRHLREIAADTGVSPAGLSDILRRLKKVGLLNEDRRGNRRYLSLKSTPLEQDSFRFLAKQSEAEWLERRSLGFSKVAKERFQWMDDTYRAYRRIKK
ncbi:MAG: helix-turn-helix transcriptional regulator [Deltaproteobacteria bacterium]|nr:helix-turn-helix transcriptional regulator [Deltaproteobacteria bacterium]